MGCPLASRRGHQSVGYARSACGRSSFGPGFDSPRLHFKKVQDDATASRNGRRCRIPIRRDAPSPGNRPVGARSLARVGVDDAATVQPQAARRRYAGVEPRRADVKRHVATGLRPRPVVGRALNSDAADREARPCLGPRTVGEDGEPTRCDRHAAEVRRRQGCTAHRGERVGACDLPRLRELGFVASASEEREQCDHDDTAHGRILRGD